MLTRQNIALSIINVMLFIFTSDIGTGAKTGFSSSGDVEKLREEENSQQQHGHSVVCSLEICLVVLWLLAETEILAWTMEEVSQLLKLAGTVVEDWRQHETTSHRLTDCLTDLLAGNEGQNVRGRQAEITGI